MPRDDDYLTPYREAARQHGSDFDVTLWVNRDSQALRFTVFTQMLDLGGKRVLDAGCSRGDLAAYLDERGIAYERYIGVDALPDVVDHARTRHLPRSEFHTGDFVHDRDLLRRGRPHVVAISGTLNTMSDEVALELLDHAWDAAGETLIFNFLPDTAGPRAPRQEYPARRLPTLRLLAWALERTWDVRYVQDYFAHGHDGTIAMRKHP